MEGVDPLREGLAIGLEGIDVIADAIGQVLVYPFTPAVECTRLHRDVDLFFLFDYVVFVGAVESVVPLRDCTLFFRQTIAQRSLSHGEIIELRGCEAQTESVIHIRGGYYSLLGYLRRAGEREMPGGTLRVGMLGQSALQG